MTRELPSELQPKGLRPVWVGLLWTVILVSAFGNLQAAGAEAGGESDGISVQGYRIEGEFIVITYSIPFPGLTEVGLLDHGPAPVWRGQYVNDKPGIYHVKFRRAKLRSGASYTFQFFYKESQDLIQVSIP